MPYKLLFQPQSGASGDMLLAALLDLVGGERSFVRRFQSLGLDVKISIRESEEHHLRCKRVTVRTPAVSPIRRFADIRRFIQASPFSAEVKKRALHVFSAIFQAEAAVHHEQLKNVHLHELGADDSLVDILGFCYLWEKLEFCPIGFTTLVTGHGQIQTRHGRLPVPPPAVLKLIEGCRFQLGEVESELLTPTAAAILTRCGRQVAADEAFVPLRTGIGAGHRSWPGVPNILRAILCEERGPAAADEIWVLEFQVDDMSGELLAAFSQRVLASGALDVMMLPGLMKKGRPGYRVTVLCSEENRPQVVACIFAESTTIGLRLHRERRLVLERRQRKIRVASVPVRIKESYFQGRRVTRKPEMEDVWRLAENRGIPVKEAMQKIQESKDE